MATTRARSAPPVRERRADARRNVAAILDAAQHCLARDPDANVSEIAQAAGVGRVTLYGHFKTRADLVDAVLARTVAQADAVLDTTDTTGDPREALTRLIASTWQIVDQFRSLLRAAQSELTAGYSVMHAAAEDCTAGRLDSADGARIIAATLLAAFTPPGESVPAVDVGHAD